MGGLVAVGSGAGETASAALSAVGRYPDDGGADLKGVLGEERGKGDGARRTAESEEGDT
jgi:hypothetical protein